LLFKGVHPRSTGSALEIKRKNVSLMPYKFVIVAALLSAPLAPALAQMEFGDDSSEWANDGECDDPRFIGESMADILLDEDRKADATDCRDLFDAGHIAVRTEGDGAATDADLAAMILTADRAKRGRLEAGDGTLDSGEYRDSYVFEGRSGELAVVDLHSEEFDTYLMVLAPSGEQFDNDDHDGDTNRSLVTLMLEEAGAYAVIVTSYEAEATGAYSLRLQMQAEADSVGRSERAGDLRSGDRTLESGEFLDSFEFVGRPGQRVSIDLRSADFDTYLILVDPTGEQQENDDGDGGIGHSHLEAELTEVGMYEVIVTSYAAGEVGEYALVIDQSAAASELLAFGDAVTVAIGSSLNGVLEAGDAASAAGEFQDLYTFEGAAGERIRIELTSDAFDTYLGLITPRGNQIDNDDYAGGTARSVLDFELPETGSYRIVATSYGSNETGAYQLSVDASDGPLLASAGAGGRTYGVFAGISDYPGKDNDLEFTAEDAVRVRDAMIRGGGMLPEDAVTLLDADATAANLRDAIELFAAQAGPEDTFVLFYSGHGNRVERESGPDAFDPDALDETIELYDRAVRDDELRAMLESVRAGTTLLLMDSCFSGGFAKDLISVPGRMGMFSSEEDVASQVASQFRAGGYLAYFLDEAIGERLADEDGNGEVTALELSEYVHFRYRNDVKSGSSGGFVRADGPRADYQHLVVDRGSISPFDVLFPYTAP